MRRNDTDIAGITAAADAFEAARRHNGLALTEANHAFHRAIASAARNPHLATFYDRLLDQSARLARVSFSYQAAGHEAHLDNVIAEHRAMADAIATGNALGAEKLGHDHAALFQRRLLDWLTVNNAAALGPVSKSRA
jgi:DNA-binding FadR family transcriptional regulator